MLAPRQPAVVAAVALFGGCAPGLDAGTLPDLLAEAIDRGLPGAVVVVDGPDEALRFAGAAGSADVDGGVAMTVDVGFRIASNSKAFVGLALASMHVDGLVDLDRPLGDAVAADDLRGVANADRATLRQALDHSSGVPDYLAADGFWDAVDAGRGDPWTIRDALAYARGLDASGAPGRGWDYSNTNYLLAGLALERAGGRSWAAEVRARVLDPLGMARSFVENGEEPRAPIAHGYSRGVRDMFAVDTGYGLPDGGVVATAPELATFIRAVGGGPAPSQAPTQAIARMLDGAVSSGEGERYGLGVAELETPCGRTVAHGGNLEGYLSEMYYVPERDLAVIVFVNASDGWVDALFDAVATRALEIACEVDGA
jgi:D-alanyl-D-alanine carboxypeptidase